MSQKTTIGRSHGGTGDPHPNAPSALLPVPYKTFCAKCGARRIDSQLGLEATPEQYVANMVAVFREVKRVLRDDGTLWLNLGDSYTSTGRSDRKESSGVGATQKMDAPGRTLKWQAGGGSNFKWTIPSFGTELKPKDLCGIPWRVAFALQADGWYLRSDIIWAKPNPMPESVTDRPTKAHEYLFLLTKQERYFYDSEAIKEPSNGNSHSRGNGVNPKCSEPGTGIKQNKSFSAAVNQLVNNRSKRSVWTIATQSYPEAHFATFPEDLVKPCILAGSRSGDMILDPFGGSGTVGKVALELGRSATLIELSADYCNLARDRINVTPGFVFK